ncbi:putative major facilitator, sugar transporter, major facilitator superfamily [Helianthus annuus]|uniref:Major facilitator, sugar transporter, major facilitator superfamily n=1 Tax=Helianthus annuus TaxID=4232 RepID=A0A251RMF2_HELAN|nr:sugar transporter ERD6-like 16 [Helianthus annuus]KAF5753976.1 putative major facilitator, sugar transporter, major facilitator superfamily [Helianthus annuus]KAJ0427957.1 putative major facilitator, sugar transporter, major facilitator superfamily [Helianthus annuus]KAJ0446266.1 putative major facilitator, sugar transporter, major facilitator superfamily [Helianthus annuus]
MAITDIENGDNKSPEDLKEPFIVNTSRNVNSSQETDQNGTIKMALLSTAVAVCGSTEFGACVGFSAPTQLAICQDLNLSVAEFSLFGSIITIGAMIGAVTSGRIADTIGRKGSMALSAVICIAGWLAIFMAMGSVLLDTGRFFTGYGIGIFTFVVPVYIAEISPKELRGGLTTLNQFMIVTGSSISFLLGTVVSWRTLAITTGLAPCILLIAGLFFIPESPRWLAKVGRKVEFENSLRKLRGEKANITVEAKEIQETILTLQSLPKARLLDLFEPQYIKPVIISVGLMICQQSGGINGIGFYASETFIFAGLKSGKSGTIAYALIQIPITIVGMVLLDKSGRRVLLLVSSFGTCLGCFITGTAFFFKGQGILLEWVPFLAVSGVLLFIAFFSVGMGAIPWLIMSEIFPLHIKGAAGSLVCIVNWLGAWVVSYSFNFLINWSPAGTFWLFAGFGVLNIIFVAKLVPETKGKSLEEIQASL